MTGQTIAIRCTCGTVQGEVREVRPSSGNHAVCYCRDCQSFAHFLGRAPEILDEHGGTDIFQTTPAKVVFTHGADRLACMRLSEKGLLRWYASCCRTPIGNTLASHKIPFIGFVGFCLAAADRNPASLAQALGPVDVRGFRQFAKGDAATIAPDRVPLAWAFLRFFSLMARWKLGGHARRSPFFLAGTGQAVAAPRVLSRDERGRLREQVRVAAEPVAP